MTAAGRIADSINRLPQTGKKPVIIIISGLPGTGKTFFCRRLAERLPYFVIESDALRKVIFPKPSYSPAESAAVFRVVHYLIDLLLRKGVSVIMDATNLVERYRKTIYNIAEKTDARLIIVSVEAPPEVVRKRLKARTEGRGAKDFSDADWAVYWKMKTKAEKIKRDHITADTSKDITPVIERIIEEANR